MELDLGLTQYLPLALYIFSILIFLLTLFYKIEIGIYFIILMLPQENLQNMLLVYPYGKDLFDVFTAAFLIKWVLNKKNSGEPLLAKTPLNRLIFLIILWTFFSLWYGSYNLGINYPIHPGDFRVSTWKEWLIMFLLFWVVVNNIKSPKQISILIWVFAATILLVGFYTFQHSAMVRRATYFSYASRAHGTFTTLNANGLGAFLAQYALFLTAIFITDKNIWRRLVSVGTASLAFFSMLFTFSRAGYLASLVGFFFLGVRKSRILLIPMMLFLVLWNYILPSPVVIRVNMTFNKEGELDESSATRLALWEQAMTYIYQKPLTGNGFRTTPFLHIHSTYGLAGEGMANSLHSGYVELLTELGIIGLVLFLFQFGIGMRMGLRILKNSQHPFHRGIGLGFFLCALGILANNTAHDFWYSRAFMGPYWILLGVITRLWINMQNSVPSEAPTLYRQKLHLKHKQLLEKLFNNSSAV